MVFFKATFVTLIWQTCRCLFSGNKFRSKGDMAVVKANPEVIIAGVGMGTLSRRGLSHGTEESKRYR